MQAGGFGQPGVTVMLLVGEVEVKGHVSASMVILENQAVMGQRLRFETAE